MIIIVRTAPRPKKLRFSNSEMPSPNARETGTTVTVNTTVEHTGSQRRIGEDRCVVVEVPKAISLG